MSTRFNNEATQFLKGSVVRNQHNLHLNTVNDLAEITPWQADIIILDFSKAYDL